MSERLATVAATVAAIAIASCSCSCSLQLLSGFHQAKSVDTFST